MNTGETLSITQHRYQQLILKWKWDRLGNVPPRLWDHFLDQVSSVFEPLHQVRRGAHNLFPQGIGTRWPVLYLGQEAASRMLGCGRWLEVRLLIGCSWSSARGPLSLGIVEFGKERFGVISIVVWWFLFKGLVSVNSVTFFVICFTQLILAMNFLVIILQ